MADRAEMASMESFGITQQDFFEIIAKLEVNIKTQVRETLTLFTEQFDQMKESIAQAFRLLQTLLWNFLWQVRMMSAALTQPKNEPGIKSFT